MGWVGHSLTLTLSHTRPDPPLAQEAVNFLEKKMKSNPTLSRDDTIQTAVAALQAVLSEDFKATEIEVGVVSSAGPSAAFRVLSTEEVEEHLTAISERE